MSDILEKIRKRIPLHKRILTNLIYPEYNWDGDGNFLGKIEVINEEAAEILKDVLQWVDDGMPGIEKTKEFIEKKNYKLETDCDDEQDYYDDEDYEKAFFKDKKGN